MYKSQVRHWSHSIYQKGGGFFLTFSSDIKWVVMWDNKKLLWNIFPLSFDHNEKEKARSKHARSCADSEPGACFPMLRMLEPPYNRGQRRVCQLTCASSPGLTAQTHHAHLSTDKHTYTCKCTLRKRERIPRNLHNCWENHNSSKNLLVAVFYGFYF